MHGVSADADGYPESATDTDGTTEPPNVGYNMGQVGSVDQRESKKAKGNTARRGDPSCAPFVQTEQLDTDHDSFSSKYALKMDSVWRCVSEMTP